MNFLIILTLFKEELLVKFFFFFMGLVIDFISNFTGCLG